MPSNSVATSDRCQKTGDRNARRPCVNSSLVNEEYEYEDQDPVYDVLYYNDDMTGQDWLDFQRYGTDFHRGEY